MNRELVVVQPIAYRPDSAAEVTGLSRTRIYELIASGEIPARKDGRCTVILHEDLEAFVRSLPEREAS